VALKYSKKERGKKRLTLLPEGTKSLGLLREAIMILARPLGTIFFYTKSMWIYCLSSSWRRSSNGLRVEFVLKTDSKYPRVYVSRQSRGCSVFKFLYSLVLYFAVTNPTRDAAVVDKLKHRVFAKATDSEQRDLFKCQNNLRVSPVSLSLECLSLSHSLGLPL